MIEEIRGNGIRKATLVKVLDIVSEDFTTQGTESGWIFKLGVNKAPSLVFTPTYNGSFQDMGGALQPARYWIDKDGLLHLTGVVDANGSVNGDAIFNVPFAPTNNTPGAVKSLRFPSWSNGAGSILVQANGDVIWENGAGPDISLDGICWRTT